MCDKSVTSSQPLFYSISSLQCNSREYNILYSAENDKNSHVPSLCIEMEFNGRLNFMGMQEEYVRRYTTVPWKLYLRIVANAFEISDKIMMYSNVDGSQKLPMDYIGMNFNAWILMWQEEVRTRSFGVYLLLLDAFNGHDSIPAPGGGTYSYLPANSTSSYQSMDQNIVKGRPGVDNGRSALAADEMQIMNKV
eukprot:IDg8907t1